jgi:hypothetical protein
LSLFLSLQPWQVPSWVWIILICFFVLIWQAGDCDRLCTPGYACFFFTPLQAENEMKTKQLVSIHTPEDMCHTHQPAGDRRGRVAEQRAQNKNRVITMAQNKSRLLVNTKGESRHGWKQVTCCKSAAAGGHGRPRRVCRLGLRLVITKQSQ